MAAATQARGEYLFFTDIDHVISKAAIKAALKFQSHATSDPAAFSQAGAESIVASLWKVNDLAARDFMVTFHRGLQTVDRASALQRAQLALRQNPRTAHPFYWAPFILFGAR
jgi:CHAT domain-containing protein